MAHYDIEFISIYNTWFKITSDKTCYCRDLSLLDYEFRSHVANSDKLKYKLSCSIIIIIMFGYSYFSKILS